MSGSTPAGSFVDWPEWHKANPQQGFSQWLKATVADDWHTVTHHPFTDDWGQGKVPTENLRRYLVQDHRFLDRFAALLAGAVSRAPTLADRIPGCQFLALITGKENTYFERCFTALGVRNNQRSGTPDWDATKGFKDLMAEALESASYANMVAVLAVAEGTYLGWADRVAKTVPTNPPLDFWFSEWIDLHTGAYFESVVAYLNGQLDAIGPDLSDAKRAACQARFARATKLEIDFFDTAQAGE
jgi:thiaminase/transcriptional activator TenA